MSQTREKVQNVMMIVMPVLQILKKKKIFGSTKELVLNLRKIKKILNSDSAIFIK